MRYLITVSRTWLVNTVYKRLSLFWSISINLKSLEDCVVKLSRNFSYSVVLKIEQVISDIFNSGILCIGT